MLYLFSIIIQHCGMEIFLWWVHKSYLGAPKISQCRKPLLSQWRLHICPRNTLGYGAESKWKVPIQLGDNKSPEWAAVQDDGPHIFKAHFVILADLLRSQNIWTNDVTFINRAIFCWENKQKKINTSIPTPL